MQWFYKTLDLNDLKLLSTDRGYEGKGTKIQLIDQLLDSDQRALVLTRKYDQEGLVFPGLSLVLCHGRAHVKLLNLDYNRCVFIDSDEASIPDYVLDVQYIKELQLPVFDQIFYIYCGTPNLEQVLTQLKSFGSLYVPMPKRKHTQVLQSLLAKGILKYKGQVLLDAYHVQDIQKFVFDHFQLTK